MCWQYLQQTKKSFATYYKGLTARIGRDLQAKFVDAFVHSHGKLAA